MAPGDLQVPEPADALAGPGARAGRRQRPAPPGADHPTPATWYRTIHGLFRAQEAKSAGGKYVLFRFWVISRTC